MLVRVWLGRGGAGTTATAPGRKIWRLREVQVLASAGRVEEVGGGRWEVGGGRWEGEGE